MKNNSAKILTLIMAIFCIVAFASCKDEGEGDKGNGSTGNNSTEHEHSFTVYVPDGNASCTADGTKTAVCDKCDVTKTVTDVGSAGHRYSEVSRKEVSCTENGYVISKCAECGKTEETVTKATGHNRGDSIFTGEYCGDQKVGYVSCTNCDEELVSLGHTYTSAKVNPTCISNGSIVYTCTNCSHSYTEYSESYGHIASSDWVLTLEPTCTAEGVMEKYCKVCDIVVETKKVDKAAHNYVSYLNSSSSIITYTCAVCHASKNEPYVVYCTVTLSTGDGTAFAPILVPKGGTVGLPEPKLSGYNFAGWYAEEEFVTAFDEETVVAGDITVYAAYTKPSEKDETNTNNIFTDVSTDFTFKVTTKVELNDENLKNYITIEAIGTKAPTLYILNKQDTEYTIAGREYVAGETYSVSISSKLEFVEISEREFWFTVEKNDTYAVEYKSGVVFVALNRIYSAFEQDGKFYLFFRDDILDVGDTAVIYGETTDDIISIISIISEGTADGGICVYEVGEGDTDNVFESVDVYYSGALEDCEIEFAENLKEIIISEVESSAFYKQLKSASVIFASSVKGTNHYYKFDNIKINPTFSTDSDGKCVYVSIKVSSVFQRIESATNREDGSLWINFEIQSDLTFNVTLSASDYDQFYFNVAINNKTSVDLYVTTEESNSAKSELSAFKKIFDEAKESGEFSEVDTSTAAKENETVICSVKSYVNGVCVGFDISNVFQFDVVGEIGIDSTVEIVSSYGIKNSPDTGLQTMKSISAKADVAFCVMGKAEMYDMVQVDVYAIFLGVVNAHIDISAGPQISTGGMFYHALYSSSYSEPVVTGGQIQVSVKNIVSAGVNAKLQIFVKLFGKKIGKDVTLFDKEWTIYAGSYPIFTLGSSDVALRFEKESDDKTINNICGESVDISALFDTNVLYQNFMTLKKTTKKAACTYYLSVYQPGIQLSSLGILTIDADGQDNIAIKIKVVCDNIFKEVTLIVNVSHDLVSTPVDEPTCTEEGSAEFMCTSCNEIIEGKREIIPALGHLHTSYKSNDNATCTDNLTMTSYCERCNVKDEKEKSGTALGHSFTKYKSNGDGNCIEDGTKTATCDRCPVTNTITDIGSTTDHKYKRSYDGTNHWDECTVCYAKNNKQAHTMTGPAATCITPDECSACNYYVYNSQNHEYQSYKYISNDDGTHTSYHECCDARVYNSTVNCSGGKETCIVLAKCSICKSYYGDYAKHVFTDYISNNDATIYADGTKTAECDTAGCTATKTVTDVGSILRLEVALNSDNATYSVIGIGTYPKGQIIVPPSYDGIAITKIAADAFRGNAGVSAIEFASSITTIGNDAFRGCTGLTEVKFKGTITIGNNAFRDCTSLTIIDFSGTTSEWLNINKGTDWDYGIGEYTVYCKNGTVAKDGTVRGHSEGLKFEKNVDNSSYSVTGIGTCNDTNIAIPMRYEGLPVTAIEDLAFFYAGNVKSIKIPSSIISIGNHAFGGCSGLESVIFENGSKLESIGEAAFENCIALTSIVIGNNVKSIGNCAFQNCSKLESITIGNKVERIGNYAFKGCIKLTAITIPDSVTSFGEMAFADCSELIRINYNSTVSGWSAIKKGLSWDLNTGEYTVICTNGTVPKQ